MGGSVYFLMAVPGVQGEGLRNGKCPNPIQTSDGYSGFSWTILGHTISYGKFYAVLKRMGLRSKKQ